MTHVDDGVHDCPSSSSRSLKDDAAARRLASHTLPVPIWFAYNGVFEVGMFYVLFAWVREVNVFVFRWSFFAFRGRRRLRVLYDFISKAGHDWNKKAMYKKKLWGTRHVASQPVVANKRKHVGVLQKDTSFLMIAWVGILFEVREEQSFFVPGYERSCQPHIPA